MNEAAVLAADCHLKGMNMSRSNVIQLRKRPYTQIEDYQPFDVLPDEVADSVPEIDAILDLIQASNRMLNEAVEKVAASFAVKEIGLDVPLRLRDAVCLPELGGTFTVDPTLRTESEVFSIKTLQKAIGDGKLAVLKPNKKNQYVTRRAIQEFLESCLDRKNPHTFGSVQKEKARMAVSRMRQSTSFSTKESKSAQDAAEAIFSKLKSSSRNT